MILPRLILFSLILLSPFSALSKVSCKSQLRDKPTVRDVLRMLKRDSDFLLLLDKLKLENTVEENREVDLGYASSGRVVIGYDSRPIQFDKRNLVINNFFPVNEIGLERLKFEVVANLLEHLYTERRILLRAGKWMEAQRAALRLHFHHQVPIFSSHPELYKLNGRSRVKELRKSVFFNMIQASLTAYKVLLPFLPPYRSWNPMHRLSVSEEAVLNYRIMKSHEYSSWVNSEISKYEKYIRIHQGRSVVRPMALGVALVSFLFTYDDLLSTIRSTTFFAKPAFESVLEVGLDLFQTSMEAEISLEEVNAGRLENYIDLYERQRFIESYPEVYAELTIELPTLKAETDRLRSILKETTFFEDLVLKEREIEARMGK